MSAFFRKRVETTIEHMIEMLDQLDGDPDLEPEPLEEQHDQEPDDAIPLAPMAFVLAKSARRPNKT